MTNLTELLAEADRECELLHPSTLRVRLRDAVRELITERDATKKALEDAAEHMVWMLGGWNNPDQASVVAATPRARAGIDAILAASKGEK